MVFAGIEGHISVDKKILDLEANVFDVPLKLLEDMTLHFLKHDMECICQALTT